MMQYHLQTDLSPQLRRLGCKICGYGRSSDKVGWGRFTLYWILCSKWPSLMKDLSGWRIHTISKITTSLSGQSHSSC